MESRGHRSPRDEVQDGRAAPEVGVEDQPSEASKCLRGKCEYPRRGWKTRGFLRDG